MPHPPIGLFGAVMGLVGLGLAARASAPLFPGVFRAPSYFTEPWIAAGTVLLVVLLALYLRKCLQDGNSVKAELTEPQKLGFAGTAAVAPSLVAAGLAPYAPQLADVLWWIAFSLTVAFLAWGVTRLKALGFATRELHPGWIVVMMGGIVLPAGGIVLGHSDLARVIFTVSALSGLFLVAPLLRVAALPDRLRPTWFILLAPPSLLYIHGAALFRLEAFDGFFYAAIVVLAGLLVYARTLHRWGFGPAWWSITFPLDAFALAAARFARDHEGEGWRILAGFAILLATSAVVLILARTLVGATRRNANA